MRTEGNVKEVLKALREKKRLLEAGDPSHNAIRVALLALSGIMRGTYGGGQVAALEERGFTETFDDLGGVSTGTPEILYFAAGQAGLGRTIYYEECTLPDFISLRRALISRILGGPPALSTRYMADVFRGKTGKALNEKNIQASRSRVHVGVTDAYTGEGLLLDGKKILPNMVQGAEASIAVPGMNEGPVIIDGREYLDGDGGVPFPAKELRIVGDATHMLILANAAHMKSISLPEKLITRYVLRNLSKGAHKAFMTRHERYIEAYESWRKTPGCTWGTIWTDEKIGTFERDPKKLFEASERARIHLLDLIDHA